MITAIIITLVGIWYITGIVIFIGLDISPSDISLVKAWKVLIIGGPVMAIHRSVVWQILKIQRWKFNYDLREWILK